MAQLELMNAAANVTSQADLDALRLTLSLFFAERAQQAIDKMWEEGSFDQKKLDELRGQHLRTPYKTFQACVMLSLTITANADYIVTEDSHFSYLKSVKFPKLTVLTLDEFNESMK